jgi:hypothetical protein
MQSRIISWGVPHNLNGELKTEVTVSALPSGASIATHQATANASLAVIESDTTSIDSKLILPASLLTDQLKVNDASANVTLTAISGIDFATQTTLLAGKTSNETKLDHISDNLDTLQSDKATDTTINSFKTSNEGKLDHISANLDTLESGKATASLQSAINTTINSFKTSNDSKLDHISDNLDTLESGKATSTLQSAINTTINSFKTSNEGKLDHISDNIDTLTAKTPALGYTQSVSGSFYQTTQPVSGTFYQTTQPVSGTFYQTTQPVSGTFYQTTQPVSIASALATTYDHVRANGAITNDSGATALAGEIDDNQATESIDADNYKTVNMYVDTTDSSRILVVQASYDNSTWYPVDELYSLTIGVKYFRMFNNKDYPFRYYRLINQSGGVFYFSDIKYGLMK